ncbi:outer membrane protein assembly factor BamE, partial [Burkholderia oklahomensis]
MRSTVIAAVAVVGLAACSSYDSVTQRIAQSITPYRITVVQGNFVSQEKASQLQAGMSRDQVRALLGTPLLTDMFHADRWDYIFYFKRGSTSVVQQRDLVLNFSGDRLASWSGADNLPSELDLLADIDGDRRGNKAKKAAAAVAASAAAASEVAAAAPVPEAEQAADQSDANAQAARA